MRQAPKIPWPYRAAALVAALMIGLYTLQIYVFGAKFAGAVAALSRAAPAPRPAPPPAPVVPGVVSVQILHEDKAK